MNRQPTPDTRTLVFANSLSATREMWRPQLKHWSSQCNVVGFNYAGHGADASEQLPAADSIAGIADALLAKLDEQGVETFDFVGLSLGGMLGLHIASRYPHRVRRLVAANCRYWVGDEGKPQWDQRINAVRQGGTDAIVDGTLERWFTAPFREQHADAVEQVRNMILGTSTDGYIQAATAVRNLDLRDQIGNITCPVLLLTGDQDAAAPADHMAEITKRVPSARLHVIENCAHLSNIEHPDAFRALVDEHLK